MKSIMKRPLVVHPLLFAIFPILFLFAHNDIEGISFLEVLLPSAIALGLTLLLLLLLRLVLKDNKKAGIIVSVFLALFFSYGHIYGVISDWKIDSLIIDKQLFLLVAWGGLFACSTYLIVRARRNFDNFTSILNVVACVLVAVSLINIGVYELRAKASWAGDNEARDRENDKLGPRDAAASRDIYYIVLDGYASSDILKEVYGFDNHQFTDYLTKKGFRVASKSRCNYPLSHLSLASSLNMEYVNYMGDMPGIGSKGRRMSYRMVRDGRVVNFLKSKGYKVIHFSSGWAETDHNPDADLNIKCGRGSEFLVLLVQTTMLECFEGKLVGGDARRRVLGTFSRLGRIPEIDGPKFVFAHIISPHPPYLFDANGWPLSKEKLETRGVRWEQKQNYLDQLVFVNKKVEALVDEILSKSKRPPIIILQADHGSGSGLAWGGYRGWDSPTDEMIRERMRIFNAAYLPGESKNSFYDSITSVNTFRLIFNSYFGTDFEMLDDQSYFSTYKRPYQFRNVTDKVK